MAAGDARSHRLGPGYPADMSMFEPDDAGPPESISERASEEHGVDVSPDDEDDSDLDGISVTPPD